jgi:hypothetical protein
MPRIRSFIHDNGVIAINVDKISNANSTNIIAGSITIKKLKVIEIKQYAQILSVVSGVTAWPLNNDITITGIYATCRGPSNFSPQGKDLVFGIRRYLASNGTTISMGTFTIPKANSNVTSNTVYSCSSGDSLYFDVVQVGSTQAGAGLRLDITYY